MKLEYVFVGLLWAVLLATLGSIALEIWRESQRGNKKRKWTKARLNPNLVEKL